MIFLRDQQGCYSDLEKWRYGFDPDVFWIDWMFDIGSDSDTTETLLFGA